MRHLVGEVEAAEAAGMTAPEAIADHFNAKGVTTRKGRRWTGATMAKFLTSPGANRYRSDEKAGPTVKKENQNDGNCQTTSGYFAGPEFIPVSATNPPISNA